VYLKQLRLEQFRNLTAAQLEPGRYLTILHGRNGQGKTNLLEAVYMLGSGRAFRTTRVPDLIQHGSVTAAVTGRIESAGVENRLLLLLEGNSRRISVDAKNVYRAAELHGKLPVVIFTPDDTAMVKLGPETRRRYLDRSLYAGNAGFLQDYHSYYRTLKQRNALLKSNQQQELLLWTEQLAAAGIRLMQHRSRYLAELQQLLQHQYAQLAGGNEGVAVQYKPDIAASTAAELLDTMQAHQEQDLRYRTTNRGPHRDDLLFLINGRPLKGFGSQGQQRSFVLALKLAEMDHLQQTFGEEPVLLLDDIASELDRQRISNLVTYLRKRQVQVIITTTDVTPFQELLQHDSRLYRVDGGNLTYEGNGIS